MTEPVQQDISARPVDDKSVITFINRELIPVLRAVRKALNALIDDVEDADLDALALTLSDLSSEVGDIADDIAQLQADYTTLNTSVTDLDTRVDALESSGVGAAGIWAADVSPSSPSVHNDEFNGNTFNTTLWSTWDVPGILTKALDGNGRLLLTVPTGTTRFVGIYQPVPAASEYAIYAKVATRTLAPINVSGVGIFLAENLTTAPSTADLRTVGPSWFVRTGTGVAGVSVLRPTAYNSVGTSAGSSDPVNLTAFYVRIRVNGATWGADWSSEGTGWLRLISEALTITPVHMGIYGSNGGTGVNALFASEFFRVFTGAGASDFYASHIGGAI